MILELFGYVIPEKSELKIREYELYRAYYCGVCKSMGRKFGQMSRLTLTYDSAFLVVLLSCITENTYIIKRERCIVHPLRKRFSTKSDIIEYASDMNLLLAYYNLKDKWMDDKSVLSVSGMLALKNSFKKLRRKYSKKCAIIENKLDELHNLEVEGCNSMDRASEPFAKIMEEVLTYEPLCTDENICKILKWIGYNIGKWIYIIDAFNDIKKDLKNGNYNPLILQFGYNGGDADSFKTSIMEKVEFNLTYALGQIAKSYELLDNKNTPGIVENIIYLGLLKKTQSILKTGSCRN